MSQAENETLSPDQLAAIVRGLEEGRQILPVEAIQNARRHKVQVIPELIKLLR